MYPRHCTGYGGINQNLNWVKIMETFDLEQAIQEWKRELWKQQGLEPGFIEEIEGNLRDRIDDYLGDGYSEEQAFALARKKSLGNAEQLADEYFKARTNRYKTPPWKKRGILFPLVPWHFKIAYRNILKEKTYSILNIVGLTIGITFSVFLLFFIADELSYDRYHEHAEQIYRVATHFKEPDNEFTWATAQIPLAPALKDNFPEVINAVRFFSMGRTLYEYKDKQFYEEDFYLADSTVFHMFTYNFIEGEPGAALIRPNTMVITSSIATKYFGTESAVGKVLQNEYGQLLEVTGVISNIPENSHFRFDGLISRSTEPNRTGGWSLFGVYTYIQLPENYDPQDMQSNFDLILKESVNPLYASIGTTIHYELQRITDIHLYSKIQEETEGGGDISYIYIFSAIAAFLIIIACINYMNLATAKSVRRAKEVGIRKVMGSQRKQLVFQFLTESVVLGILAMMLSLITIFLLLPVFNEITNKSLSFGYVLQPKILLSLVGIIVTVGILAGSYPAFYLSAFNPVKVLKGKVSSQGGQAGLRKTLVVLQFCISIFMLICTLVIYNQLSYMRNKDLGFDKEKLIQIEMPGNDLQANFTALKNQLENNSMVLSSATSSHAPGNDIRKMTFSVESNEGEMVKRNVNYYFADDEYVQTLGMEVIEGSNFSKYHLTDTIMSVVLVNESMVERMNWEDPIGKRLNLGSDEEPLMVIVCGVLKNYHQNSLYSEIEPLMVVFRELNYLMYVKIAGENIREAVKSVEKNWKEIHPEKPFLYAFLDKSLDQQYKADEKRGQIFAIFSILTITIACLGLLGLASFATHQRTKEIGIRKVMGASIKDIILLVSSEFIILTSLASFLAFVGAYFFLDQWLNDFVYRIALSEQIGAFLLSAVLVVGITLLTVSFHAIKAAILNPVISLRSE